MLAPIQTEALPAIELLCNADAGAAFKAILNYAATGEVLTGLSSKARLAFEFLRITIDEFQDTKNDQEKMIQNDTGNHGEVIQNDTESPSSASDLIRFDTLQPEEKIQNDTASILFDTQNDTVSDTNDTNYITNDAENDTSDTENDTDDAGDEKEEKAEKDEREKRDEKKEKEKNQKKEKEEEREKAKAEREEREEKVPISGLNALSDTPPKAPAVRITQQQLFERFWHAYPRKQNKQKSAEAFAKLKPDEALVDRMLDALSAQQKSQEWQREGGAFIPYPSTWLNGRRWEDELSDPAQPSTPRPVPAPAPLPFEESPEEAEERRKKAERERLIYECGYSPKEATEAVGMTYTQPKSIDEILDGVW